MKACARTLSSTLMLGSLLMFAPVCATRAQAAQPAAKDAPAKDAAAQDAQAPAKTPVAQQIDACKQQEQDKGKDPGTSAVKCAVKVIFQSRIRSKNRTEPVEMTVSAPPMVTDDTGTPGPGDWEIDLGIHSEFAAGEHRTEFPTIDINYGAGERLQFNYAVPYVFVGQPSSDGTPGQSAHGFGDSLFGVKYRFYDNKDTGLSFAVGPQLEFRTPGGSKAISENATGFVLPVMMTKEYEHASISANVGVEASGGEQRYFASFGAGKRLTDHIALLAEIAGVDLNSPGDKHILLNVGVRDKLNATQSLSAALGHDIYSGSNEQSLTYVSFYYQKLFGK
jgi:hypothetical protein